MVTLGNKRDLIDFCKVDGSDLLMRLDSFELDIPKEKRAEFYNLVLQSFIFALEDSPGHNLVHHPRYIVRVIKKINEYKH